MDKKYVGSGQTGQCCGFVRTFYNSKEMAQMAFDSLKYIKKLCRESPDLTYETKGLLVIDSINNANNIKENVELLNSLGIKAKYLEGEELQKVHPFLKTENVCACLDQEAGYINPATIANYLAELCKKSGVDIFENTEVTNIQRKGSQFIVSTNNETFLADKVFNATAAFSNKINKFFDIKLDVKAINIDNAFYRAPLGPNRHLIAIADFVNHFYIIPHESFIDVSSIALDLNREIDPDTHDFDFSHDVVTEYLEDISERIPELKKSSSIGGFNSCIDVTPDYYTILSEIDEVPNYYCATGFSGTGFKLFPMIGKLMAELIMGKTPKLLESFRYNRFAEGKMRKEVSDSYFVKE